MTQRATSFLRGDAWAGNAVDSVALDHDGRARRRLLLTTEAGTDLLLDLAEVAHLRDGDGLVREDGAIVRVVASAEPLMQVTARDAAHLVRLAWHVGNRHLPAQIGPAALLLRRDHVIGAMLEGLGATVQLVDAPFDPEGGAYDAATPDAHQPGHHRHHDDDYYHHDHNHNHRHG